MNGVLRKANAGRGARLEEEMAAMRPLAATRLPEFVEEGARVNAGSTIRIRSCAYSVPSRLIGEMVRVRVYEDRIEVRFADVVELACERLRGNKRHRIDYRHVIWSLVRKPGAFARYVYREEMFPSLVFRRAYDAIQGNRPGIRADLEYLRVLHLAASTIEADVQTALESLLAGRHPITIEAVKALVTGGQRPEIPDLGGRARGPGRVRRAARGGGRVTTRTETIHEETLHLLMRALKLPAFARYSGEVAATAEAEGWLYGRYLHHLAELEIEERRRRRIERNQKESDLPGEKTLATLNRARLPGKIQKALPSLCEGTFVERGGNVLAFGLPGRGKTHLACAIGHELVQRGYRVFFTPTYALVQRLLQAKRDLRLERELVAWTASTPSSWTTSATSSRAATRWRCSSRSSRNATSAAASSSPATSSSRNGTRSSRTP